MTNDAIDSFLATRESVCAGMPMLGFRRPRFTVQQLNRDLVTRIQSLDFHRHINETIGLNHRRENTGALVSGHSNLEHTFFPRENAAQEMPPIAPLGKSFLE